MAALTLLLPALARIESVGSPAILERWIARGNALADAKAGREAGLRECFEFTGKTLPSAALTRSMDSSDAAGALWLRADPAYAVADAVTVRMLASAIGDLSQDESDQLARALRPLFGDAGFPLETATPARWYLRCPSGSRLPQFAEPEDVLGDDMLRHLPRGDNDRQWRHLLNEAQVILHNHPVNVRRIAQGQMPATSVWFWGAGMLPQWVRSPFTRVCSGDDVVIALARLATVAVAAPEPLAVLDFDVHDTLLLDLADIRDPAVLEQQWLQPLDAALRRRYLNTLSLRFADGARTTVKPLHRWRFWRKARPVASR
ncbi:MAG: phosphoglycerate mutase [Rudaea sp.]|nr:phosphoglycerate mutase [Rudaea sp.]